MSTAIPPHELESVVLPLSETLSGDLAIPAGATSLIIFAHGSGSSRRSIRNQWVAGQLQSAGFATLLFDLLTEAEDNAPELRVDIATLGQRLIEATEWAATHASTRGLRVGYHGASMGAAVALVAAADWPEVVRAVVSRGGRPDLADAYLPYVQSPTRLIVGQRDGHVIGLNKSALARIGTTTKDLAFVPGASHLFEDPGALARATALALAWFLRYVAGDPQVPVDDEC
jgi:putative phosphoribosyl transferase